MYWYAVRILAANMHKNEIRAANLPALRRRRYPRPKLRDIVSIMTHGKITLYFTSACIMLSAYNLTKDLRKVTISAANVIGRDKKDVKD